MYNTKDNPKEKTQAEEIEDTSIGSPHVVILGAGASVASDTAAGDNKNVLPTMDNFVEVVGLQELLSNYDVPYEGKNFETVYSNLFENGNDELLRRIEKKVYDYFDSLRLPNTPTIYDHLVLSLRDKDLIASFNWDPFLWQACNRNSHAVPMPEIVFLHGNVAIGYCVDCKLKSSKGNCSNCGEALDTPDLLYPIEDKNYKEKKFIDTEWNTLEKFLHQASMLTIFGKSAPESDKEAVDLMKKAWGHWKERNLEEVEIVDIKNEEEVKKDWGDFIHTHHYQKHSDFYESWIARHPRRSCEAWFSQNLEARFLENNPAPTDCSLVELQNWFSQLIEKENGS